MGPQKVLSANACTIQMYSLTWANVHVQCNCVNGGGIGFSAIFKDLMKPTFVL